MPSRNRRRVRNFTIALLLLGLAAWIVPSYFSAERYRRRLQAGLERALHRPVKFGAVSFRFLPRPGFSIEDVEVDEDSDFGSEPFARVDHIDCDLRWHSLWRSRMDFAHLYLDHPSFNVVLNSRGEWNVGKLLLQSGVTAPTGDGHDVAQSRHQRGGVGILVKPVMTRQLAAAIGSPTPDFALRVQGQCERIIRGNGQSDDVGKPCHLHRQGTIAPLAVAQFTIGIGSPSPDRAIPPNDRIVRTSGPNNARGKLGSCPQKQHIPTKLGHGEGREIGDA